MLSFLTANAPTLGRANEDSRPPREDTSKTPKGCAGAARLYAQGDILIERVDARVAGGRVLRSVQDGSVVIAQGEGAGHHHRIIGSMTLYRDDALARDLPPDLYVAHVQIDSPTARLEHDEHAAITLRQGTYRVRRQRELEPTDVGFHDDDGLLED